MPNCFTLEPKCTVKEGEEMFKLVCVCGLKYEYADVINHERFSCKCGRSIEVHLYPPSKKW